MIEVEIRGPLSKKKYDELKKLFEKAGDSPRSESRIFIDYSTGTLEERVLDIRLKQKGKTPEIVVKKGKKGDWSKREEIITKLAPGEFSNAVATLASLGHTKGIVCQRELFHARFGGAEFTLAKTHDEDLSYYEAEMLVKDPIAAKEAERALEVLAKKLKLPVWSQADMFGFIQRLNERVNYEYDFAVQGPDHFKNKFGI